MATAAREPGGLIGYLRNSLGALRTPRLIVPVLLLTLLLTASNIVILMNLPTQGAAPGLGFALAAAVRVLGLLLLSAAILRIVAGSARRPFMPDAGFWLYALTFVLGVGATALVRVLTGVEQSLPGIVVTNILAALLLAPLTAWFVALAVERPVPWSPARWVRALPAWLPHFLFWTFVIVTPLAALHAGIDMRLARGEAGNAVWPLLLFDGPLSAVMALIGLGLASEAYRRVAHS